MSRAERIDALQKVWSERVTAKFVPHPIECKAWQNRAKLRYVVEAMNRTGRRHREALEQGFELPENELIELCDGFITEVLAEYAPQDSALAFRS